MDHQAQAYVAPRKVMTEANGSAPKPVAANGKPKWGGAEVCPRCSKSVSMAFLHYVSISGGTRVAPPVTRVLSSTHRLALKSHFSAYSLVPENHISGTRFQPLVYYIVL